MVEKEILNYIFKKLKYDNFDDILTYFYKNVTKMNCLYEDIFLNNTIIYSKSYSIQPLRILFKEKAIYSEKYGIYGILDYVVECIVKSNKTGEI